MLAAGNLQSGFFSLVSKEVEKKVTMEMERQAGLLIFEPPNSHENSAYTVSCEGKDAFVLSSPGCLLQVHGIKCKMGGYLNKRMHTSCMS